MQTKQYSVKVCETHLGNEDKFISFFTTNYQFFKEHLIVINGDVSKRIEDFMNEKGLSFLVNTTLPNAKGKRSLDANLENEKNKYINATKELESQLLKLSEKKSTNLKVLDSLVRSGQELKIDGDLLLLNRVNSGATISIEGNLIITQIVDGSIRCNGEFMMLKASNKANIVFHDVEVDNNYLQERLNRVELIDNEIKITPVLKETNWGA